MSNRDLLSLLKEAYEEARCQEMEVFWLLEKMGQSDMINELEEFFAFRKKLRREDVFQTDDES